MKKTLFLVLAVMTLSPSLSHAGAKKAANDVGKAVTGKGGQYGMAGCGLGSMVFDENNSTQILAATTNGTFGSQTFGITFGTSNCGKAGALVMNNQINDYIAANKSVLATEIARGEGETLNGLASMLEVKDHAAYAKTLKTNYANLFPKNSDLNSDVLTQKLIALSAI